jgi:hypothetical protein
MRGTLTHADKAVLLPQGDTELTAEVNAWLTSAIKESEPAHLLEQHLRH